MGHQGEDTKYTIPARRTRVHHTTEFKRRVVNEALRRPANARVKPTARCYPGIQPVQIRQWIRQFGYEEDREDDDDNDDDGAESESDSSEILSLHKLCRAGRSDTSSS
tara:strand:+ start:393 stop:716 length:324 start_codon:yes stop_codon:yes gene_type:complete